MTYLQKILAVVFLPIKLTDIFGGIIAIIWLAFLGEWEVIGYGIGVIFTYSFIINLLMIPSLLFSVPAIMLDMRGQIFMGYIFCLLTIVYTTVISIIWSVGNVILVKSIAGPDALTPALILSYVVATGALAFLAHKDSDAGINYTIISAFFTKIAFLSAIIIIIFFEYSLMQIAYIVGIVMMISLIFSSLMLLEEKR